jgi:hypothetical protein
LNVCKTHEIDLLITGKGRGLSAKTSFFFLRTEQTGQEGNPADGSGGLGRRRLEWLGARVKPGIGRGDEGDQDRVLTLDEERRGRPESEVNRAGGLPASSLARRRRRCRAARRLAGLGRHAGRLASSI